MRVTVLGSAAGGGFPQWNCACPNCSRLRAGRMPSQARSQAQVFVCPLEGECYLLNASPDLRTQILSASLLNPAHPPRHTPIAGVLLTSADVDSVVGLLHLREFQPLQIYSTPSIQRILLEDNHIFRVLDRASPPAVWHDVPVNTWFPLGTGKSSTGESSVRSRMVPLGSAYPDYVSEDLRRALAPGEAVTGLVLAQGGKQIFYAPALPGRSEEWKDWARSSDLCLLDGTFWDENELISAGVGSKTAREIGHVPLSGADGLLAQCDFARRGRRVLIHINNTNPILDEESPEHRAVRDAGWEIAYDGMSFEV
ncbi:MAG TPA: pyrroloquinoline quinone biosynthesis protein PqqB [Verrucomicrobiae bacterium]|nr:pyrroloquinoline quinone biosynthesis protein PqqB [Verrucomicrobiae bacterium]